MQQGFDKLSPNGKMTPLPLREMGAKSAKLPSLLHYPKFKLSAQEQQSLLADFLPYAETVRIDSCPPGLPLLRDPDDVIFTALTAASRADALVSGDGDLQAVREQFHIPILTITEFADWLQAH